MTGNKLFLRNFFLYCIQVKLKYSECIRAKTTSLYIFEFYFNNQRRLNLSFFFQEYTLFLILRQKWYDKRLQYDPIPGLRALELDPKAMNNVWVPDLYFQNEKRAHFHELTTPNKLLHIYSDGLVIHTMRYTGIMLLWYVRKFFVAIVFVV